MKKIKIKLKKKRNTVILPKRSVKNLRSDRMPNGRFAPGNKFHGSRKGVKNKFTTLKHAFVNTFERLGGEDALIEFCTISPAYRRDFFNWIARMLPREVNIGSSAEVKPNELEALTDQELDDLINDAKESER